MAERLVAAWLVRDLGPAASRILVRSAGTRAYLGEAMHPMAADVLLARGADPAGFRSQALTADDLSSADLVLAATREHRAAAATLHPRVLRRCFTVREFGRLAAGVAPGTLGSEPAGRLRALVGHAAGQRGQLAPPRHPSEDDVADPYGRPAPDFEACADVLTAALTGPIRLLTR